MTHFSFINLITAIMRRVITFKTIAVYGILGVFSMGKTLRRMPPAGMTDIIPVLMGVFMLLLLIVVPCSSQGMGSSKAYDQRGYDYMGSPVSSAESGNGQVSVAVPGYLNPYTGATGWDASAPGLSSSSLQMEQIDPASLGLSAPGGSSGPANQLYVQSGSNLAASGTVSLGDSYVLWARAGGRGNFVLYDYSREIFSSSVTAGWYRIQGAYGDFAGQHLYRFFLGGQASNNVTVMVSSAGYPTSYSLTGRVQDATGEGLAGVTVTATNSDGGRFSTVTGEGGYYAIDVASGVYVISARLEGYVFTQTTAQAVAGMVSAARPIVGTPSGSRAASSYLSPFAASPEMQIK